MIKFTNFVASNVDSHAFVVLVKAKWHIALYAQALGTVTYAQSCHDRAEIRVVCINFQLDLLAILSVFLDSPGYDNRMHLRLIFDGVGDFVSGEHGIMCANGMLHLMPLLSCSHAVKRSSSLCKV